MAFEVELGEELVISDGVTVVHASEDDFVGLTDHFIHFSLLNEVQTRPLGEFINKDSLSLIISNLFNKTAGLFNQLHVSILKERITKDKVITLVE